jgi:chromosome segregation ATPase
MDQELIAYLNERFNAIDQRFDAVDKRFDAVDKRFDAADKRFDAVDKRFDAADERMDGLEGAIRANGVEIEGLRGDIKQVAEGVAATNQRIDAFQTDVSKQFEEMRQIFNASHSNLHSRVSALESRRAKRVERRT